MINKLGINTDTVLYKKNGNEIHHSFIVGQKVVNTGTPEAPVLSNEDVTIHLGTPVGITATGKVLPLSVADANNLIVGVASVSPSYIGQALMTRKTGEQITICLRGRLVVKAVATGAVDAGPGIVSTPPVDDSLVQENLLVPAVENVTSTSEATLMGWILTPTALAGQTYFLYKH